MSKKQILINQPAGLGDICFLQKAADIIHEAGFNIIWPVVDQLLWVKDYIISKAEFVPIVDVPFDNRYDIIDFASANELFPDQSVMEVKYYLIRDTYHGWEKHFRFNRNKEKEDALFSLLNLEGEKYSLVSRNIGTPPHYEEKDVFIPNGKIVELDFIEGYTLFDWCKVIENASAISVVDSAINYLVEVLDTTSELYMTSRFSPPNYLHINNIFNKNWKRKF